jgi:hypothetical protein
MGKDFSGRVKIFWNCIPFPKVIIELPLYLIVISNLNSGGTG